MIHALHSAPGISQGLGAPNQHSFYGKKLPLWGKKNLKIQAGGARQVVLEQSQFKGRGGKGKERETILP